VLKDPAADAEIAALRGVLHDKESMCNYCASKLDRHIGESLFVRKLSVQFHFALNSSEIRIG
jgi:hypothetical protein